MSWQAMAVKTGLLQVHSPPPKHISRPQYEVTIFNEMHQFNLLYMPSNTLCRRNKYKYKYILPGIDVTLGY